MTKTTTRTMVRPTYRQLGSSLILDDFRALERMVAERDRGKDLQDRDALRRRLLTNTDHLKAEFADQRLVTYQRPTRKFLRYDEDLDPQLMDREQTIVDEDEITVYLPRFLHDHLSDSRTVSTPHPTGTEMFEFEDQRTLNTDMPDNLVYADQGVVTIRHPWIDTKIDDPLRRPMNAADFRERCVQRNGRNHVIYQKTSADCQPAQHRRPEWLAEQLPHADWDDVMTITECFRKLSIDRPTALKLIHGYCLGLSEDKRGKKTSGLKKGRRQALAKWAKLIEDITDRLPELSDERLDFDGYRQLYLNISEGIHFDNLFEQAQWIEESAREYHDVGAESVNPRDVDRLIEFGFCVDEPDPDPLTEWWEQTLSHEAFQTNPCSSYALHYGEDNIPYEIVYEIKSAPMSDITEKQDGKTVVVQAGLRTIAQRMYEQQDQPRADYEWMNYAQRSQFWRYYNERRQSLAREYRRQMSRPAKKVLKMVIDYNGAAATKALIYAYQNGKTFESDTDLIQFDAWPRPTEKEVYVLWAEYNQRAA